MNRIFLIGYMGSGKTTIGKLLAHKMGYSFVDMDAHIEEKYFKTISQMFAEKGEDEFRQLEQKSLHEVAEFENVIIATGGGAPCFFDNMEFMNERGLTIYLKLTANELAERLELIGTSKRPLLAGKNSVELREFIAEGLAKREPYYEKACHSLSGTIEETVIKIYKLINADN
jgi:shikimate kinase